MNNDRTFDPFRNRVAAYDRWYDSHPELFTAELEMLRACLGEGKGRGLEIGVGTGRFAAALGIDFGIDPSPSMLSYAVTRNINICQGSGEQLPFLSRCFDVVLLVMVLCFIKDRQQVLLEAHRVLKDSGRLVVGCIDRDSPIGRKYQSRKSSGDFYQNADFMTKTEMTEFLHKTGFRVDCYHNALPDSSSEKIKNITEVNGFVSLGAVKAKTENYISVG